MLPHRLKRLITIEHTKLSFIVLILYCGLIFFLSSLSQIELPSSVINFDKLLHISAYSVLGFLSYQTFINYKKESHTFISIIIPFVFSLLYGISDEIHQSFVPGRESDVYDVITDAIGIIIGIFIYRRFII